MEESTFERICDEEFRFLIADLGFRKGDVVRETLLWKVTYSGPHSRAAVTYERREQEISVTMCPINTLDGRSDEYHFWHDRFYIQVLLNYLGVQRVISPPTMGKRSLTDAEIAMAISDAADAVKTYALTFLAGDHRILPQIQAFVRRGFR